MKGPVAALKAPLRALPIRPARTYDSRIDRTQSPIRILIVPILSVLLGSMITALPFFYQLPMLPPMGLMIFLSWRLMRPGLWPIWAGLPFGIFDDIFSGQIFGSAAFIWSMIMLVMELVDSRAVWRDHWQDWFIAAVALIASILAGWYFVGLAFHSPSATVLVLQILISILSFPVVIRFCARLDKWRLAS